MHQSQCQRGIGSGAQCNVFMAFFCRFTLTRVYANQFGAIAFGFLGDAPKMQIATNRITAPNDDEFRFSKKLHPHAHLGAEGVGQGFATSGRANSPVEQ